MSTYQLNKISNQEVTIDRNMRDYKNEPVFVKKAESAKKFIKKYGLPKDQKNTKNN